MNCSRDNFCLEWEKLNYSILSKKFQFTSCRRVTSVQDIIINANGQIPAGSLVCIMGPSGAGKTSLLALLSQRIFRNYTGQIRVNGLAITRSEMIRHSAFIPQLDITNDILTVGEHLAFIANLKLHLNALAAIGQTKLNRINELLQQFGMIHLINSKIGVLSTGEKKKLNLISELFTNPKFLFCDEPTTGLDSENALSLIRSLRKLTSTTTATANNINNGNQLDHKRKINSIFCSIHQPNSLVFSCFTHILLMHHGRTIFVGTTEDAAQYFQSLGFTCPDAYNPGEFYIKIISQNVVKPNAIEMVKHQTNGINGKTRSMSNPRINNHSVSWICKLYYLLHRSFTIARRTYSEFFISNLPFLMVGVIFGLCYADIALNGQESIQNIQGFIYMVSAEIFYGTTFNIMYFYPSMLPHLRREIGENLYPTSVHFVTTLIGSTVASIINSMIFLIILYAIIGFLQRGWLLLEWSAIVILSAITSNSLGILLSSFCEQPGLVNEIAPPLLLISLLLGGSYRSVENWYFKYFSVLFYTNELLSISIWKDIDGIDCEWQNVNDTCLQNGTQVLDNFRFSSEANAFQYDCLFLFLGFVIMNLLAFLNIKKLINKISYY